jgi:ribosomal protein S18 acetylase RimI-like enzyme
MSEPVRCVEVGADEMRGGWAYGEAAWLLLRDLVAAGAALGWVAPPTRAEVAELLAELTEEATRGDASLIAAVAGGQLLGLGHWRRYARPTHRVNADVQKVAVDRRAQGRGVGAALVTALVASARAADVEVLTLDVRADNDRALRLYDRLGFREYGRLPGFVAMGSRRYDKVFCYLDLRAVASQRTGSAAGNGHSSSGYGQ